MSGKEKILIVDDSQTMRELLKIILRDYDIAEAADGRTALRTLSSYLPDLILLEMHMPGMDGKSLLGILKHTPQTRHIPVIHMTAVKDPHYNLELIARGADDIIGKPCNAGLLKARVARLLAMKHAYDELGLVPSALSLIAQQTENRLPFLQGHTAKTLQYTELLGQQLLLPLQDVHDLRVAASLILLGYCAIPDEIFKKDGFFVPPDWAALKQHTVFTHELCSHFTELQHIGIWLREHHERVDGSGYPAGLAGNSISLGGRCLAIAEAYAALTSGRPYRPAYDEAQAAAILQEGAGEQWDAELVANFLTALEKTRPAI